MGMLLSRHRKARKAVSDDKPKAEVRTNVKQSKRARNRKNASRDIGGLQG